MTGNPNAAVLTPGRGRHLIGYTPEVVVGARWLIHKVPRVGCNV